MTDNEINKAVAERVMGWRQCLCKLDCEFWYEGDTEHTLPAYCTDPAAWGGLYDWLRTHGWEVSLIARGVGTTEARARHHHARGYFGMAEDAETGRALALAALKAHGVEVTQ